jgi:hypothetical protein
MEFYTQKILENEKNRWKKDVFKTFFDGAMQCNGAFKTVDKSKGNTIGSTRFYD